MKNLYPIININKGSRLDLEFAGSVLKVLKPFYLQIRMKDGETDVIAEAVSEVIRIRGVFSPETKIIVNDSIEAAVLSGADGVHVGQSDCPVKEIKKKYPGMITGLSTHDISQIKDANKLDVDYIGFGPVFNTSTKENLDPPVLHLVEKAVELSKHPIVFIGGLNKKNIESLPLGNRMFYAVISALDSFIRD